jgi:hypothetical protein
VGRDSVVSIATRCELDGRGSNLGGGEIFRSRPDRDSRPTKPPVQWVPGLFSGGKAAGYEADRSSVPSAEVKSERERPSGEANFS